MRRAVLGSVAAVVTVRLTVGLVAGFPFVLTVGFPFGLAAGAAGLAGAEAATATEWVRKHVDKRTVDLGERMDDIRDHMWELEKDGQIIVHRITDAHKPIEVQTLFGWVKKIPTVQLWHHKSCGQCGNIPGYPTSLLWFMNKFDFVPNQ